jgi:hypothetical protein
MICLLVVTLLTACWLAAWLIGRVFGWMSWFVALWYPAVTVVAVDRQLRLAQQKWSWKAAMALSPWTFWCQSRHGSLNSLTVPAVDDVVSDSYDLCV